MLSGLPTSSGEAVGLPRHWPLLAYVAFVAVTVAVLAPALRGDFINDDFLYVVDHPYTSPLDADNLIAILDPFGPAMLHGVNYAPVQLLLHAAQRVAFGNATLGYHLTNVLVHAASCVVLVALLLASRVPRTPALLGGLVFAVHPANVEAVAWISQLKTDVALLCALAAVLARRAHPMLAIVSFAIGLLSKAAAAAALPMAIGLCWARRESPREWRWLAGWGIVFALFAIPEINAHRYGGGVEVAAYQDPWVHVRSIVAIGARYLVMAATSKGVSAFHDPEPVLAWGDPWWIAGLVAGVALAARLFVALRARREEAAWWLFAAASFVPISQISPFLHPIADRYLYFILPGLIGGSILLALSWRERWLPESLRGVASYAAIVLTVAGLAGFASRARARAPLWQAEIRLLFDSAAHYPKGGAAAYLRAVQAAAQGDADTAVRELRYAADRDLAHARSFSSDPGFAPVMRAPVFRDFVDEIAGRYIDYARRHGFTTQPWLRSVASAHRARGEYEQAIDSLERAMRVGGPLREQILYEMEATREEWRGVRAAAGDATD